MTGPAVASLSVLGISLLGFGWFMGTGTADSPLPLGLWVLLPLSAQGLVALAFSRSRRASLAVLLTTAPVVLFTSIGVAAFAMPAAVDAQGGMGQGLLMMFGPIPAWAGVAVGYVMAWRVQAAQCRAERLSPIVTAKSPPSETGEIVVPRKLGPVQLALGVMIGGVLAALIAGLVSIFGLPGDAAREPPAWDGEAQGLGTREMRAATRVWRHSTDGVLVDARAARFTKAAMWQAYTDGVSFRLADDLLSATFHERVEGRFLSPDDRGEQVYSGEAVFEFRRSRGGPWVLRRVRLPELNLASDVSIDVQDAVHTRDVERFIPLAGPLSRATGTAALQEWLARDRVLFHLFLEPGGSVAIVSDHAWTGWVESGPFETEVPSGHVWQWSLRVATLQCQPPNHHDRPSVVPGLAAPA